MRSLSSMAPCPPRVSQLEMESLPRQLPVLLLVEPVEARGSMGHVLLDLVQLLEHAHGQELLAEVPLVEARLEHGLVEVLELGERELGGQQLEADRLVARP